jgi:hypothetical protein
VLLVETIPEHLPLFAPDPDSAESVSLLRSVEGLMRIQLVRRQDNQPQNSLNVTVAGFNHNRLPRQEDGIKDSGLSLTDSIVLSLH